MRYFGGKAKIGVKIADILKKIINKHQDQGQDHLDGYIEPFCGALGVLRHMTDTQLDCYASDICNDLILLWSLVQKGKFKNPHITEKDWLRLKNSKKDSALKAFAGFGCSFGGQWFSGFSNNFEDKDHSTISYNSIMKKIAPYIKDVQFNCLDYRDYTKYLKNKKFLIYCDGPYMNTEHKFSTTNKNKFDYDEFWSIMRLWTKMGSIVFVSEYNAPSDFICIFEIKINNGINAKHYSTNKCIEKLFVHKSIYKDICKLLL
jgi:DNA adenine methylase